MNHSLLIVFHGSKQSQKSHLEIHVVSQKFHCDSHLGCESKTKKSKLYLEHADFVNEIITSGIKAAIFLTIFLSQLSSSKIIGRKGTQARETAIKLLFYFLDHLTQLYTVISFCIPKYTLFSLTARCIIHRDFRIRSSLTSAWCFLTIMIHSTKQFRLLLQLVGT